MLVNMNDVLLPAKKSGYGIGFFNAVRNKLKLFRSKGTVFFDKLLDTILSVYPPWFGITNIPVQGDFFTERTGPFTEGELIRIWCQKEPSLLTPNMYNI